ncbi:MAG: hypothetical protein WC881_07925 [Elusimicrobiota bacterium]|jgi:hypothetical protein
MTHLICTLLLSLAMPSPAAAGELKCLAGHAPADQAPEIALYEKMKGEPGFSESDFCATREFLQTLKKQPASRPKVTDAVKFKYTLSVQEQLKIFEHMLK